MAKDSHSENAITRLVLSRKVGESIRIGDITIEVARLRGNKVRLAIAAPRKTRIVRGELDDNDHPPAKAG